MAEVETPHIENKSILFIDEVNDGTRVVYTNEKGDVSFAVLKEDIIHVAKNAGLVLMTHPDSSVAINFNKVKEYRAEVAIGELNPNIKLADKTWRVQQGSPLSRIVFDTTAPFTLQVPYPVGALDNYKRVATNTPTHPKERLGGGTVRSGALHAPQFL